MKKSIFNLCIFLAVLLPVNGKSRDPVVVIKTEFGDITIELYADKAPVTTKNFLRYVDSSLYQNACFYRVVRMDNQPHDSVKIEVVQGGRWENDNKDGQGFAAFGKVINGMDVVKKIHSIKAAGQYLDNKVIIFNICRM